MARRVWWTAEPIGHFVRPRLRWLDLTPTGDDWIAPCRSTERPQGCKPSKSTTKAIDPLYPPKHALNHATHESPLRLLRSRAPPSHHSLPCHRVLFDAHAFYHSHWGFFCVFVFPMVSPTVVRQLSTLGSAAQVGEKLSKGRDMELVSARDRVTEGIRLYVRILPLVLLPFFPSVYMDTGSSQKISVNHCFGQVVK